MCKALSVHVLPPGKYLVIENLSAHLSHFYLACFLSELYLCSGSIKYFETSISLESENLTAVADLIPITFKAMDKLLRFLVHPFFFPSIKWRL